MPVMVLIRRCVRPDRIAEFKSAYTAETPRHDDFIAEFLTQVSDPQNLPPALKGLRLGDEAAAVFVNVALWKSAESFAEHFEPQEGQYDPEIETSARLRTVLEVSSATGHIPEGWLGLSRNVLSSR